jgi:putative membrane protein
LPAWRKIKNNMKKILLITLSMIAALLFNACSNNHEETTNDAKDAEKANDSTQVVASDMDNKFVTRAANDGMFEIEMGKLAETKATTPEVKELAKMMVEDHTKASNELKAASIAKGINLPTEMENSDKELITKFSEKKGIEFDKDYASLMVDKHKDAVELFDDASQNCKDNDLKAWAAGALPTLKHHLEMAENTNKLMKDKK